MGIRIYHANPTVPLWPTQQLLLTKFNFHYFLFTGLKNLSWFTDQKLTLERNKYHGKLILFTSLLFDFNDTLLINLPMLIHDIVKIGEFIGPTLKGKKLWDKKPKKCPKTFKCFYAFLSLLVSFLIDKVIKLWNKTKNRTQIFALWWGFGN